MEDTGWTPAEFGSGLIAWFDPADTASLTLVATGSEAGRVEVAGDKSGTGNHVSQTVEGGYRWRYDAVRRLFLSGGTATTNYDPDANGNRSKMNFAAPLPEVRSVAVFIAEVEMRGGYNFHSIIGADHSTLSDLGVSPTASYLASMDGGGTSTQGRVARDGGGWTGFARDPGDGPFPASGAILLAEWNAAQSHFEALSIGRETEYRFAGALGDIMLFDRGLTAEEKSRIEGYLAHKYARAAALPAAHPYRASPPPSTQAPAPVTLAAADGMSAMASGAPAVSAAYRLIPADSRQAVRGTYPFLGAGSSLIPWSGRHQLAGAGPRLRAFAPGATGLLPAAARSALRGTEPRLAFSAIGRPPPRVRAGRTLAPDTERRVRAVTAS